jgi:hypothetical protein
MYFYFPAHWAVRGYAKGWNVKFEGIGRYGVTVTFT